jgi:hypothetical protein
MAQVSTNMALNVWNLTTDTFNHTELANNLNKIDVHDHTTGKGVQIPTGGIANLAVTTAKIADANVTVGKIADALKPSAGAAAGTEALRAIGSSGSTVVAGNDSRLTDRRSPTIPFVSALPGAPTDGQVCAYVADATNGIVWYLQYRAADASAYKWNVLGGGFMYSEVDTLETILTTTGAYVDVTTVGPQITVPLAGDYTIQAAALLQNTTNTAITIAALKQGAATPAGADTMAELVTPTTGTVLSGRTVRRTSVAASTVFKLQYSTTQGGSSVSRREMLIRPTRVG